jgi:hypothetical protein
MIQDDLNLPPRRRLEISHSLTDQIIKRQQPLMHVPLQPKAPTPHNGVGAKSTTTQHLVELLEEIWTVEINERSSPTRRSFRRTPDHSLADLTPETEKGEWFEANIKNLVPLHQQAITWISYFHAGPNKLFWICSPIESL